MANFQLSVAADKVQMGYLNIAFIAPGLLSVKKSEEMLTSAGSTLQRVPPDMRIFFPDSPIRSSTKTRHPERAAKWAAVWKRTTRMKVASVCQ